MAGGGPLTPADVVWAGAAFETYALRNARRGDTLSESTRRWFRVHTRAGKVGFVAGWVGFSVWWVHHIVA